MSLTDHRALKFFCLFALYFLQGWVAGFTGTALINHLAETGLSVGELGRFSFIIGFPWIIQFVWSPLVDRFPGLAMGKRRGWLICASLPANLLLLLLVVLPYAPLTLALVFLAHSLCSSVMDTAVDGMMIDNVKQDEAGLASALTNAGAVIGSCVSAIFFSWYLTQATFQANALVLFIVSLAITAAAVSVRERRTDKWFSLGTSVTAPVKRIPLSLFAKLLMGRLRKVQALSVLAFSFVVFFLFACVSLTFNAKLLNGGGWTSVQLSRYQSILGVVSASLGALGVGKLCDRFGDRVVFAIGLFVSALAFAFMAAIPNFSALASLTFLTIAPGLLYVAFVPRVIAISRGAVAATAFTFCMTTMNFGSLAGAALSLSDRIFQVFSQATVLSLESLLFFVGSVAALAPVVGPLISSFGRSPLRATAWANAKSAKPVATPA